MRLETLQTLSVGLVFIGLLLATLGGFGAFHFGHRLDRSQEQERIGMVQTFAQAVTSLRGEQSGLLERVDSVEKKVVEPEHLEIAVADVISTLREEQRNMLERVRHVETKVVEPEKSHLAVIAAVGQLRDEQRAILDRVSTVEKKIVAPPPAPPVAQPLHPPVASIPPAPPPPVLTLPATEPPSPPAVLPLAPPISSMPNILLPHLPAIAQGPPEEPAASPPPALKPPGIPVALKPPKIPLRVPTIPTLASASHASVDEGPLSGARRSDLVKRLRGQQGADIVIRTAADNPRAVKLAITFKSVFREAGWMVGEIEMVTRRLPPHTLLLSTGIFPPPKEFVAAYAALARSGFLVTSDLDPNQSLQRVVVTVGPIP